MTPNALTQYLDLYASHRQAIDQGSSPALNALRAEALDALQRFGRLPRRGDEGYARTDIDAMFAPDMGINIGRLDPGVKPTFGCTVPNLSPLLVVIANDTVHTTPAPKATAAEGLTVCTLREAARTMPELVTRHYGKIAPASTSPQVALNTLLAQDGVMIYVARGARPRRPVQIVNILSSTSPTLALRRVLVVAEDDAQITVLNCDHTADGCSPSTISEVVEIFAGANARVDWYGIEENAADTRRTFTLAATQQETSELHVCSATLTNGVTRNDFHITTPGTHTITNLSGMAIGSGSQVIDNHTRMDHIADYGHSRQIFKYVLDDSAHGAFEGLIEVHPGARFVEAYQTDRNILASPDARMHAEPHLLIYNDDVKCSHGAATGQLDAAALFYMQTRGIPLEEGRRMLMQAFMVDVIDTITLEPLRDRLRYMVENRFNGNCHAHTPDSTSCHNCHSKTSPDA